jgi:D-threo-aldose 1-dehydrogenase
MNSSLPVRTLGRTAVGVTALGLGTAPLGNLYRTISDVAARETVDAALELGIRYFDTAPYYGFGLSEQRVGEALAGHANVVVSTKAGRLLKQVPHVDPAGERHGFLSPMPFEPEFDYSYDGVLRSHEQSLQRLGLARVDILLIHDIGRQTHGDAHAAKLTQLIDGGGLNALRRLRDEGTVSAIGLGVNEVEICLDLTDRVELDVLLLAGRYTLLEQGAIDELLPRCTKDGVSVVIGGPFNSGILATGVSAGEAPRYNYNLAPAAIRERASRLEVVCASYNVPLVAAALQFPLAHPAVSAVIPGFASAAEVRSGVAQFHTPIPAELWTDLQAQDLIDPRAPVPAAKVEAAAQ